MAVTLYKKIDGEVVEQNFELDRWQQMLVSGWAKTPEEIKEPKLIVEEYFIEKEAIPAKKITKKITKKNKPKPKK
jgi:hypothetical protein